MDLGDRIIKVNHAGEHGAISIYSGQIFMARVTARSMLSQLAEFGLKKGTEVVKQIAIETFFSQGARKTVPG
jgi:demethoxyubiquinone hydroxylase (CLK1/Coq7/Cat5 family)